ncbi:MAG: PHB depolymerase family esterase [Bacteroidota bacterium]
MLKFRLALLVLLVSIAALPEFVSAQAVNTIGPDTAFTSAIYKGSQGVLPYRLLLPAKVKDGKKYPLVINLHGSGERGGDNVVQLMYIKDLYLNPKNRKKFPAYVLAPQCPAEQRWASYSFRNPNWKYDPTPTGPMQNLMELIKETMEKYPIDPQRVYVTGLSLGGNGTFDIVARNPGKFAAAAPVCGWGDSTYIDPLLPTQWWIFHGSVDAAVPVGLSRAMYKAIKAKGGKVKYTEYPGVNHDSWKPAYKEKKFLKWMFSKKLKK